MEQKNKDFPKPGDCDCMQQETVSSAKTVTRKEGTRHNRQWRRRVARNFFVSSIGSKDPGLRPEVSKMTMKKALSP